MKFNTNELRKRAQAFQSPHAMLAIDILCDYLDECEAEEKANAVIEDSEDSEPVTIEEPEEVTEQNPPHPKTRRPHK